MALGDVTRQPVAVTRSNSIDEGLRVRCGVWQFGFPLNVLDQNSTGRRASTRSPAERNGNGARRRDGTDDLWPHVPLGGTPHTRGGYQKLTRATKLKNRMMLWVADVIFPKFVLVGLRVGLAH